MRTISDSLEDNILMDGKDIVDSDGNPLPPGWQ